MVRLYRDRLVRILVESCFVPLPSRLLSRTLPRLPSHYWIYILRPRRIGIRSEQCRHEQASWARATAGFSCELGCEDEGGLLWGFGAGSGVEGEGGEYYGRTSVVEWV